MKISAVTSFNQNSGVNNSQPIKPPVSFHGVYLSAVETRAKQLPSLKKKGLKVLHDLAELAEKAAEQGNYKPKTLIELILNFLEGADSAMAKGEKFKNIYKNLEHSVFRNTIKHMEKIHPDIRYAKTHSPDKTIVQTQRWVALAESSGNKGIKHIDINHPPAPIAIKSWDKIDIIEFLGKYWKHGTEYRKLHEQGSGLMSWLAYRATRLFYSFDEFGRRMSDV